MKKASFQVIYTRFFIISIRYKIMFQFLQLCHDHSYGKMVLTLTIQKSFKYLWLALDIKADVKSIFFLLLIHVPLIPSSKKWQNCLIQWTFFSENNNQSLDNHTISFLKNLLKRKTEKFLHRPFWFAILVSQIDLFAIFWQVF